jgi:hypothetical protein
MSALTNNERAIAREIAGTRWNGFVFFGLERAQQKGAA